MDLNHICLEQTTGDQFLPISDTFSDLLLHGLRKTCPAPGLPGNRAVEDLRNLIDTIETTVTCLNYL